MPNFQLGVRGGLDFRKVSLRQRIKTLCIHGDTLELYPKRTKCQKNEGYGHSEHGSYRVKINTKW
jgi:hypothetical protein